MNIACPLNSVKKEVRDQFFDRNQSIVETWSKTLNKYNIGGVLKGLCISIIMLSDDDLKRSLEFKQ